MTKTTHNTIKSHAAIARELCSIAGRARGHDDLETLLDAAVDALLTAGGEVNAEHAARIYSRYSEACIGWRAVGASPDENQTISGVGDYTRDSARGILFALHAHTETRIDNETGELVEHHRNWGMPHVARGPMLSAPRIVLTDRPEGNGVNEVCLTPSAKLRAVRSAEHMKAIRPSTPRARKHINDKAARAAASKAYRARQKAMLADLASK